MEKFKRLNAIVAAINYSNIDTDAIIPKQYLKSIRRSGFGPNLFDDWRYLDPGGPGMNQFERRLNPDFVLNNAPYTEAQILLTRENFACGSSREHAVWALMDFGIRVIIAPSYADIFYNNSFKNGLLPIVLDALLVEQIFQEVRQEEAYRLDIDLERQLVSTAAGAQMSFEIDGFRKYCLLNGFDDIDLTMQHSDQIKAFEKNYYSNHPWLGKA